MSSIDGKSTEDTKTFPYVTDVITLIRNSGLRLKVWDYISAGSISKNNGSGSVSQFENFSSGSENISNLLFKESPVFDPLFSL